MSMKTVRSTKITIAYCPVLNSEADLDMDCDGCDYYCGLNKDLEVLCNYEGEE